MRLQDVMTSRRARTGIVPTMAEQEAFLRDGKAWRADVAFFVTPEIVVDYGAGREWFAVRTNPRCEERAQVALGEWGFDTYAPRGIKAIIHRRTKKRIEREFMLIAGYVFVAMPADPMRQHWGVVRKCQGVKAPVNIGGTPLRFPAQEIERLRQTEADGMLRLVSARRGPGHDYRVGERLRIAGGPFAGFHADVVDISSRKSIRLLMEVLGRGTEIEFPIDGPLERP